MEVGNLVAQSFKLFLGNPDVILAVLTLLLFFTFLCVIDKIHERTRGG